MPESPSIIPWGDLDRTVHLVLDDFDKYDWAWPETDVEAARQVRQNRFVLDGEAVILRADGIFDFNALHTGKHNEEVQLCTREFERPLNSRERSAPRPGTVLFELMDGHYPNPSFICEFLLAPTEQTSGRPDRLSAAVSDS